MLMDGILFQDLLLSLIPGLLLFFHVVFAMAILKKDYSVIDIAWGLGFVLAVLLCYRINPTPDQRALLVSGAIALWGFRLGVYLLIRNRQKGQEDFRYTQLRQDWGKNANIHAYFKIFLTQPLLLLFVVFPSGITIARSTVPLNFIDVAGFSIFFLGFLMESIADAQMMAFKAKKENKGKLILEGLWSRSRHPNYFGEMLVWWGLGIVALNSVLPQASFIGALMITYLLTNVTGAPLLREKYKDHPDYEKYLKKTNAFIPKFFDRN